MKASEICIGDWFKAIDYNSPFRITAIYDDVVQTQANYQSEIDGNWYSEAYIKDLVPIELTEEILVKNGFKKGKTISGTELFCCEVTHQLAGDGFEIQRITIYPNWVVYVETATGIVKLGIKYIHTLQHLLRLVGVQKEIEL